MNAFEAMIELASQEKWCWNLNCSPVVKFIFDLV